MSFRLYWLSVNADGLERVEQQLERLAFDTGCSPGAEVRRHVGDPFDDSDGEEDPVEDVVVTLEVWGPESLTGLGHRRFTKRLRRIAFDHGGALVSFTGRVHQTFGGLAP